MCLCYYFRTSSVFTTLDVFTNIWRTWTRTASMFNSSNWLLCRIDTDWYFLDLSTLPSHHEGPDIHFNHFSHWLRNWKTFWHNTINRIKNNPEHVKRLIMRNFLDISLWWAQLSIIITKLSSSHVLQNYEDNVLYIFILHWPKQFWLYKVHFIDTFYQLKIWRISIVFGNTSTLFCNVVELHKLVLERFDIFPSSTS